MTAFEPCEFTGSLADQVFICMKCGAYPEDDCPRREPPDHSWLETSCGCTCGRTEHARWWRRLYDWIAS